MSIGAAFCRKCWATGRWTKKNKVSSWVCSCKDDPKWYGIRFENMEKINE